MLTVPLRTVKLDVLMVRNSHLLVVLRGFLLVVLLVVRDKHLVVVHMVLERVLSKMGRQGKRDDQG